MRHEGLLKCHFEEMGATHDVQLLNKCVENTQLRAAVKQKKEMTEMKIGLYVYNQKNRYKGPIKSAKCSGLNQIYNLINLRKTGTVSLMLFSGEKRSQ